MNGSMSHSSDSIKTGSSNSIAGHAVSRSNELLSCAKTSWKILSSQQQQQQQQSPQDQIPPNFRLASPSDPAPPTLILLEDGLTLLRSMQYGLKQLQLLVRRRGHTNDPTQDIATLTSQLEQDAQELTDFCQSLLAKRRKSPQERKHWEYVVQWFQQQAGRYSEQLQAALKLRGEILTEQAQQRRKLTAFAASGGVGGNNHKSNSGGRRKPPPTPAHLRRGTATPLFDSPLFHAAPSSSPQSKNAPPPPPPHVLNGNGGHSSSNNNNNGITNPYYNNGGGVQRTTTGYGGGYGYNGSTNSQPSYYNNNSGGLASSATMGMRQRRGGNSTIPIQEQQQQEEEEQEEEQKVHSQIQMRQQKRETQQRLSEARQAETMLGELGQMFGKMSTLISQQGETLEKIEDDVECALGDVTAGQEELTKLYGIKKGNRPLIIKTFAILNFLIIFMRAYYKK